MLKLQLPCQQFEEGSRRVTERSFADLDSSFLRDAWERYFRARKQDSNDGMPDIFGDFSGAQEKSPELQAAAASLAIQNRSAPPRLRLSVNLPHLSIVTPGSENQPPPTPIEGVPEGRPSAWPAKRQRASSNGSPAELLSPSSTPATLMTAMEGVPELRWSALRVRRARTPMRELQWSSPSPIAIEGVPEAHASAWAPALGVLLGLPVRTESPAPFPNRLVLPEQHSHTPIHGNSICSSPASDAQGSISLDGPASREEPRSIQSGLCASGEGRGMCTKAWYDVRTGLTPAGHCNRALSADLGVEGSSPSEGVIEEPRELVQSRACQGSLKCQGQSLTVAGSHDIGCGRAVALGLSAYDSGTDEAYGSDGGANASRASIRGDDLLRGMEPSNAPPLHDMPSSPSNDHELEPPSPPALESACQTNGEESQNQCTSNALGAFLGALGWRQDEAGLREHVMPSHEAAACHSELSDGDVPVLDSATIRPPQRPRRDPQAGKSLLYLQKSLSKRKSLTGAGLENVNGHRRSTRVRMAPLRWYCNEAKVYERTHTSLPTVMAVERTHDPSPLYGGFYPFHKSPQKAGLAGKNKNVGN